MPHPDYTRFKSTWLAMRHAYAGEKEVKLNAYSCGMFDDGKTNLNAWQAGYLPVPTSMLIDWHTNLTGFSNDSAGRNAYMQYLSRAQFPGHFKFAVDSFCGLIAQTEFNVSLPKEMQELSENIGVNGEDLQQLMMQTAKELLITGRCGALLDYPSFGGENPYITIYPTESIINWDNSADFVDKNQLNLVVLDESTEVLLKESLEYKPVNKYRFLQLNEGVYEYGESDSETRLPDVFNTMSGYGAVKDCIPFQFFNVNNVGVGVDRPPLENLANLCYSVFRQTADHNQALHMQSQATFVISDNMLDRDKAIRVGAGACLQLSTDGTASYAEVSGAGLAEMRQAIENLNNEALAISGRSSEKVSNLSGISIEKQQLSTFSTLQQIADVIAEGYEKLLKTVAKSRGLNEKEVEIEATFKAKPVTLTGVELKAVIESKLAGAPISNKTIHKLMVRGGMTNLSYDDEIDAMIEENNGLDSAESNSEETAVEIDSESNLNGENDPKSANLPVKIGDEPNLAQNKAS